MRRIKSDKVLPGNAGHFCKLGVGKENLVVFANDNDSFVEHFEYGFHLAEPFRLFHRKRIFCGHRHWASLKREGYRLESAHRNASTSSQKPAGGEPHLPRRTRIKRIRSMYTSMEEVLSLDLECVSSFVGKEAAGG